MTLEGIIAALSGILPLLWPGWTAERAHRQHEARLAELEGGARERHFEEKRELAAYPPWRSIWAYRVLGASLLTSGIGFLIVRS